MKDAFEPLLGPAAQRYFGVGYRQTSIELDGVRVSHPQAGTVVVRATASLQHWHRIGAPRIAHVGTVDAIRIAATVASVAMIAACAAPAGRECDLLSIGVRAGPAPDPGTGGVEVEARLVDGDAPAGGQRVVCSVGALAVELAVARRGSALLPQCGAGRVDVDDLLGPPENRYFAEGFRGLTLSTSSLSLSGDGARCTFAVEPPAASPGVIECLVVTSQLAQVALYESAGVRREATGNLWMRRCAFTAVPDDRFDGAAAVRVTRFTRFQRGAVDQVSATVAVESFPGWRGTATLAFQVLG